MKIKQEKEKEEQEHPQQNEQEEKQINEHKSLIEGSSNKIHSSQKINNITLSINDKTLEEDYQKKEKELLRHQVFLIALVFQVGFLANFIGHLMEGERAQEYLIDLFVNLSLFCVLLCNRVSFLKRFHHYSFLLNQIVMVSVTFYNLLQTQNYQSQEYTPQFQYFYLGAILYGLVLGPNFIYRIVILFITTFLYIGLALSDSKNQKPVIAVVIISNLTLYLNKTYQDEKAKRLFYIANQNISFWNNIIQNVLPLKMIVVKYDEQFLRIQLETSNYLAQKNLSIFNDDDLQEFLEKTKVEIQQKTPTHSSNSESTITNSINHTLTQFRSSGSNINGQLNHFINFGKFGNQRSSSPLDQLLSQNISLSKTLSPKQQNLQFSQEPATFRQGQNKSNIQHTTKNYTLKQLVKEEFLQKIKLQKNSHEDNYQMYNGEFQKSMNSDIQKFGLRIFTFTMIGYYALICIENESYKEKYSHSKTKFKFLKSFFQNTVTKSLQKLTQQNQMIDQFIASLHSLKKLNLFKQSSNPNYSTLPNIVTPKTSLTPIHSNIQDNFNSFINHELDQKGNQKSISDTYKTTKMQNDDNPIHNTNKNDYINFNNLNSHINTIKEDDQKQKPLNNNNSNDPQPNQFEILINPTNQTHQNNFVLEPAFPNQNEIIKLEDHAFTNKQSQFQTNQKSEQNQNEEKQILIPITVDLQNQKIKQKNPEQIIRPRDFILQMKDQIEDIQLQFQNIYYLIGTRKRIEYLENEFTVKSLYNKIKQKYQYKLKRLGINLSLSILTNNIETNDILLKQDEKKVFQIISNLISNAITFNSHNTNYNTNHKSNIQTSHQLNQTNTTIHNSNNLMQFSQPDFKNNQNLINSQDRYSNEIDFSNNTNFNNHHQNFNFNHTHHNNNNLNPNIPNIFNTNTNNEDVNKTNQQNKEKFIKIEFSNNLQQPNHVHIKIINSTPYTNDSIVSIENTQFSEDNSMYLSWKSELILKSFYSCNQFKIGLRTSRKLIKQIGPFDKIYLRRSNEECNVQFEVYKNINVLKKEGIVSSNDNQHLHSFTNKDKIPLSQRHYASKLNIKNQQHLNFSQNVNKKQKITDQYIDQSLISLDQIYMHKSLSEFNSVFEFQNFKQKQSFFNKNKGFSLKQIDK